MSNAILTQQIKDFALDHAGFDLVAVSGATLPAVHGQALENWIDKGYAGSMRYMVRDGKKRAGAEHSLPEAKTVISLAVNYYHPEDEKPSDKVVGKVSKYAYGADYHKVIIKKLKKLTQFIIEVAGPDTLVKTYVDTGPILEKAFARQAGLGFFGKNTNIITKEYGSFVFLASLITNLELSVDAPHTGSCGSCPLCITACPTGALLGNYELDARRCISYLTIESKEPIPQDLKSKMGDWVFGCNICQDVCPYNFRAKTTRHTRLYPEKRAGTWIDLKVAQNSETDEIFTKIFESSPVRRAKREGLARNAKVVMENQ